VIVECLTDNVNRTYPTSACCSAGQLALPVRFRGISTCGHDRSDAQFQRRRRGSCGIEAGAQDFEPADEGATLFITDTTDLDAVCRPCCAGYTVISAQLGYRPKNPVTLSDAEREEVEYFWKRSMRMMMCRMSMWVVG